MYQITTLVASLYCVSSRAFNAFYLTGLPLKLVGEVCNLADSLSAISYYVGNCPSAMMVRRLG